MTDRKKKILLIQILIFISAVLLLYFTYSNKNGSLDSSKAIKPIENEPIQEGNDKKKSNRFENVEYKGVDLNGNRYVINSKIADFELEKPELINMDIMSAVFYFKDGTVLKSEILDHERMNRPDQRFYKILAESALRAVRICQPLKVPPTGYEKWKDLQLNFDPTEMLKG